MNTPECVINPKSGRAVKTSGKLGKQILASQKDGKKEPHTQYKKPIGPVKPKEAYTQYKSANDVRPNRKDFEKKKELQKNGNNESLVDKTVNEMKDFNEYFQYGNIYKITSKETLESDISKITDKFSNDAKSIQKKLPLPELMDKANKKQLTIIKKYLQTSKYKSFEKTMQGVINDRLSEGKMNTRVMLDVFKTDKLKIGLKN